MRSSLLVLVACGAAAQPPQYTLRQFLEVHRANTPQLSPDGARLAYTSNESGTWQVYITTSDGAGTARQLTTAFPKGMGNVIWSPVADELALAIDHDGDQKFQLYVIPAAGGDATPLTDATDVKHDLGGWSHDGRFLYYASNDRDRRYFDCWTIDVRDKRTRLVLQRDAVLECAALSHDGRRIAAVERASEVDHQVYVAELGAPAQLVTPHEGHARFRVVGFSPDGAQLYVTTDEGRDFVNLAAIDLASKQLRFLEDEHSDTDAAVLSRDGTRIALSHNRDGYEEITVVDAASGRVVLTPELPRGIHFPGEQVGDRLPLVLDTPTHDDDVFVLDTRTKQLTRLTRSSQAGIDEAALVTPELIHYPARDGRTIPALFYRPKRGGVHPVILSIHGGPEAQEQPWFDASYQFFAQHGYAVLAPNIRGSSGFGKQYLTLDDGARRWDALADLAAAVTWLRARRDVDAKKIVAWGYSYGGFATLAMLVHYPDLFAGGVDWYGPTDLTTFLNRTAEYRRGQRIAEYGDPAKDAAFLDAISPIKHVDKIVAPLLVIQGGNDPIVPPAESAQLVEELKKRGRTVRYLLVPDEGHGFGKQTNQIRAFGEMVTFLDSLGRSVP